MLCPAHRPVRDIDMKTVITRLCPNFVKIWPRLWDTVGQREIHFVLCRESGPYHGSHGDRQTTSWCVFMQTVIDVQWEGVEWNFAPQRSWNYNCNKACKLHVKKKMKRNCDIEQKLANSINQSPWEASGRLAKKNITKSPWPEYAS
jgi:hypothetical protein